MTEKTRQKRQNRLFGIGFVLGFATLILAIMFDAAREKKYRDPQVRREFIGKVNH